MHGTLEQRADGRWQLQFTRALSHSPEKVWRAITEPEHLEHWFPTTIEGERAAGAQLRFAHRDGLMEPFDGEMITYEPQSTIEFRWGTDIIRIELRPEGQGTALTLLDTLDERGKAARDAAGWHVCLDALADHLRGAPDARESRDAWRAVHPDYVERMGPEGATIGPPEGFE
jgi:uncharacterized protein YndB with AHSA1/START domain